MMKFFDNKRNRIIIAGVILLISITITSIISFSNNTLPDYVIEETEVSKMYDKLNSEVNDNTIFEKYFVSDSYIKRIKRGTSIEAFKKEVNDNTIKFLKDGKEVKSGLIGTGMVLVRNETEYRVYVSGDLNGNGELDTHDISMAIEISKNVTNTEDERIKADINEDGFVTKDDITLLSRAFVGEEYKLKEVSKYEVPTMEISVGTKGENDWYTDLVSVSTDGNKYRVRGTNHIDLTERKSSINLDGFNAYKVESYNVGKEGNISGISSVTIKIDDREIEPIIEFSSTEITSEPVIATIKFNKENVFISNNDRSYEYTYYAEGMFTFEYFDITGRIGTKEVSVDWFTDAIGKDGTWRYTRLNKDEIYLREYLGESSDVVIPAEYDGLKVYGVGNNVLEHNIFNEYRHDYDMSNKHYVGSLTIEDGVEEIGDYFMVNAYAPTSLVIPDSVVKVGNYSFNEAHLTSLKLGNSIEYIGEEAFAYSMITPYEGDLILPDSIKTISKRAFRQMEINGNLVLSKSVEVIGEEAFAFVSFTGDLTIPSNVKRIEAFAFSYMTVAGGLIIENGLTYIGECAFRETPFIGGLSIPGSVEIIDSWAFLESGIIGSLTLGEGIKTIGQEAFYGNMLNGNLVIPNSVEDIEWAAFLANSFDGTLTLGSSLKYIGPEAFSYNNFTGDLIIPDSVITIGASAFSENDFTGNLVIGNNLLDLDDHGIDFSLFRGTLTLGNSLTSIPYNYFANAGFTGDLVIPDSVKSIGDSAFEGTSFGGTLTLGNNLKTIGQAAFMGSSFTGDLVIPDSVTSLDVDAFNGAGFDGTLTLGAGLNYYPVYAFANNEFTGNLVIPDNVTSIGEAAFMYNKFDVNLTLPSSVKYIYSYAFAENHNLKGTIDITDMVEFDDTSILSTQIQIIDNRVFDEEE